MNGGREDSGSGLQVAHLVRQASKWTAAGLHHIVLPAERSMRRAVKLVFHAKETWSALIWNLCQFVVPVVAFGKPPVQVRLNLAFLPYQSCHASCLIAAEQNSLEQRFHFILSLLTQPYIKRLLFRVLLYGNETGPFNNRFVPVYRIKGPEKM
jgi:hypothetical protein